MWLTKFIWSGEYICYLLFVPFFVGKASLDHMNMNCYQWLLGSVCSELQWFQEETKWPCISSSMHMKETSLHEGLFNVLFYSSNVVWLIMTLLYNYANAHNLWLFKAESNPKHGFSMTISVVLKEIKNMDLVMRHIGTFVIRIVD